MESKWLHDRLLLEQRIGDLDQRLRAITGRLKDHAHVLQTVAADLASAAG
jgi:hypothetical protein